MAQLAFLILAGPLLFLGIRALTGNETGEKKTSTGVAIATVVLGVALASFALFIPFLLQLYMGSHELNRRAISPKSIRPQPVEAEAEPTERTASENIENSIYVLVISGDRVAVGDNEGAVSDLVALLRAELEVLGGVSPAECRVVINSEPNVPVGTIQRMLALCQKIGFQKIHIRTTDE